jgi:hypothetical protein
MLKILGALALLSLMSSVTMAQPVTPGASSVPGVLILSLSPTPPPPAGPGGNDEEALKQCTSLGGSIHTNFQRAKTFCNITIAACLQHPPLQPVYGSVDEPTHWVCAKKG